MDDKDYQKKNLERIFKDASLAPVFRPNRKYCVEKFAQITPYIAYSDVMNYKCIIRARPNGVFNSFDDEEREVIVTYYDLDALVNDGWRLD